MSIGIGWFIFWKDAVYCLDGLYIVDHRVEAHDISLHFLKTFAIKEIHCLRTHVFTILAQKQKLFANCNYGVVSNQKSPANARPFFCYRFQVWSSGSSPRLKDATSLTVGRDLRQHTGRQTPVGCPASRSLASRVKNQQFIPPQQ